MTTASSPAIKQWFVMPSQVALLCVVWLAASHVSQKLIPAVPAGVIGMALTLGALAMGWLPLDWCRRGARWLLAEMLLFFIPAVVAVVNYSDLMLDAGWKIMVVIVLSTALVMTATALAVDACYRLEIVVRRRFRHLLEA
jgi:holin-like protein